MNTHGKCLMNFEEAIALVTKEALSEEDNLITNIRMGNYPSQQRMEQLNTALKIIFNYRSCVNEPSIHNDLAHSLFALAFHIQGEVDGALSKGMSIPDWFLEKHMFVMFLIIESIFTNENLFED